MNKKIITVCLLIITVAVLLVSCGKNENNVTQEETTTKKIEILTEKNGDFYIINQEGDKIPYTTSKDGAIEFVDDLFTKNAEQVSNEQEPVENKETTSEKTTTASSSAPNNGSSGGISVGSEDPLENESNVAIIDWR